MVCYRADGIKRKRQHWLIEGKLNAQICVMDNQISNIGSVRCGLVLRTSIA